MGSSRKNGRLGDPALPSLSSNSFHVKHFHRKLLESPSGDCRAAAGSLFPAGDFCGLGGRLGEATLPAPLAEDRGCKSMRDSLGLSMWAK
jgi:hypothetical protein